MSLTDEITKLLPTTGRGAIDAAGLRQVLYDIVAAIGASGISLSDGVHTVAATNITLTGAGSVSVAVTGTSPNAVATITGSGGGGGSPGGATGSLQYNNSGSFGGFSVGGDGTLNTSTGVLTVTKTGGVAFAASATIDTTNAANISTNTIAVARLPMATTGAAGVVRPDGSTTTIIGGVIVAGLVNNATTISGGTANRLLYDDGTKLQEAIVGSGLSLSAGTLSATGGGSGLVNNSTTITGGAANRLLYDDGTKLQEAIVGSGLSLSAGTLTASGGGGGFDRINLATAFGLVADGVTNQDANFKTMFLGLKAFVGATGISPSYGPARSVTLTPGTPGTINLVQHNKQSGAAVAFFGTLAGTGLTAGTPYYVAFDTLKRDNFRITATDPLVVFELGGSLTSLPITGAGSGVTCCAINESVRAWLPPGTYKTSNDVKFGGPPELDIEAYGACIDGGGIQVNGDAGVGFGLGGFFPEVSADLNTIIPGALSITLKHSADASKFPAGSWFAIAALNGQDTFGQAQSGPDSAHLFEYQQVAGDITGGVTITVGDPLGAGSYPLNGYLDTFPDVRPGVGGSIVLPPMGPVRAYPCSANWGSKVKIAGLLVTSPFQNLCAGRFWELKDCRFTGQGPVPTQTEMGIMDNVYIGTGPMVVDKLVHSLTLRNIKGPGVQMEGAGPNIALIDNCNLVDVAGSARLTKINNSAIRLGVEVGPLLAGATDAIFLTSSFIGGRGIARAGRLDDAAPSSFGNMLNNWTFLDGTLTQPMIHMTTAMSWAVPGRRMYTSDMGQNFANMGCPWTVLNVKQTADATVTTASVAVSSRVVTTGTSIANDTVVSFDINSLLPSGGQLVACTPYWVVNSNNSTAFDVAATKGGAAIIPTGAGTTNVTVYKNPKFTIKTSLRSLPNPAVTAAFTATNANPCVFTTGTNVPNGTIVVFPYSDADAGTLPIGFNAQTIYFAVGSNGSTNFKLSTDGVNALGSTSTGSGTAISNPCKFTPHPCPRVTAIACTGHQSVLDQCNAPKQGKPMFSYGSRHLVGDLNSNPSSNPGVIQVWGNLKSLNITVEAVDTVSTLPTLTIFVKGFNSSLAASNLTAVIDLATLGLRTVTPTSNSGTSVSVHDVLSNYGDWLGGSVVQVSYQNIVGGQQSTHYAQVFFEIETDQGTWTSSSAILNHDQDWPQSSTWMDTYGPGPGADPGI